MGVSRACRLLHAVRRAAACPATVAGGSPAGAAACRGPSACSTLQPLDARDPRVATAGRYATYYNGGNIPLEVFLPLYRQVPAACATQGLSAVRPQRRPAALAACALVGAQEKAAASARGAHLPQASSGGAAPWLRRGRAPHSHEPSAGSSRTRAPPPRPPCCPAQDALGFHLQRLVGGHRVRHDGQGGSTGVARPPFCSLHSLAAPRQPATSAGASPAALAAFVGKGGGHCRMDQMG